jgi:anti-anti-sigma regulatory factor
VTPPRITTDVDTSGVAILAVAGQLRADTTDGLTAAIAGALSGYFVTRLVVDLARVDALDVAAVNVLLDCRCTAVHARRRPPDPSRPE